MARKEFADLLERSARGERIKITRYRNTLAAIVSKKDLEKLEDCEATQRSAASSGEAAAPREGRDGTPQRRSGRRSSG